MNWLPATYRYTLTRSWGGSSDIYDGQVCFIMANPSTADEWVDDPTIRRVVRFSEDHGYASLIVVNLFAVRSTDPKLLSHYEDPVGPENGMAIVNAMADSQRVVASWGALNHPMVAERRQWVKWTAFELGHSLWCLGKTKAGHPRHPLYIPAAQRLELFDEETFP